MNKEISEINSYIQKLVNTLERKSHEYATEDFYHNFKIAAELQGITSKQALIGMMDKHVVSIHDLVYKDAHKLIAPKEVWEEKIGDNIIYLLILWSMINNEKEK